MLSRLEILLLGLSLRLGVLLDAVVGDRRALSGGTRLFLAAGRLLEFLPPVAELRYDGFLKIEHARISTLLAGQQTYACRTCFSLSERRERTSSSSSRTLRTSASFRSRAGPAGAAGGGGGGTLMVSAAISTGVTGVAAGDARAPGGRNAIEEVMARCAFDNELDDSVGIS